MLNGLMSCGAALVLLAVTAPSAAQQTTSDRDLLNRAHSGGLSSEDRKRFDELKQGEQEEQQMTAARMAGARALRKTPPLPAERNGLLGSWRLGDGSQPNTGAVDALTRSSGLGETLAALKSLDNFQCGLDWGGGITFTPSTFSWPGNPPLVQGRGGPIAYRSGRSGAKQVIVAITDYDFAMAFEIASPNSILDDKGCVLVRVGAPAANAAANAPTGPSATPAVVPAVAPFKSVKEQLGVDTIASVERDIKARGGSPGSIRAGSQGIATLSTLSGDYSDAGPNVTAVNYDFDGTGPAARLVAVTVVHSFGVFGDAYKKLTDERKAVLAKDFGALQVKSATEFSSAAGGYELTLFENPDTGFFYERYKRAH